MEERKLDVESQRVVQQFEHLDCKMLSVVQKDYVVEDSQMMLEVECDGVEYLKW